MRAIISLLAVFIGVLALALLVPAASAFALGLYIVGTNLVVCALLFGFVSLATRVSLRRSYEPINRRQAMILAVLVWVLLPIFAAIPFMLVEEISFIRSFYEATSALTTTGHTVVNMSDMIPPMMLWRAFLAWIGGLLTLGFIVNIIAPNNVGGLSVSQLRLLWHGSDDNGQNITRAFLDIIVPFSTLTLGCFVLLIMAGNGPFQALILALSALSTSGFMGSLGAVSELNSWASELILMGFMILGASSILWHRMIYLRQRNMLIEHRESYWLIGIIIVVILVLSINIGINNIEPNIEMVRRIAFEVTSLLTTTGMAYENLDISANSLLVPTIFVLFLTIVGGCNFSTSGGMKLSRIAALLLQAQHELQQLIFPSAVINRRVGGDAKPISHFKAVWSSLFSYFVVMLVGFVVVSAGGPSVIDGLSIAIGALSNSQLVLENGLSNFSGDLIPIWYLPVLSLLMILGRVELLLILAAFVKLKW